MDHKEERGEYLIDYGEGLMYRVDGSLSAALSRADNGLTCIRRDVVIYEARVWENWDEKEKGTCPRIAVREWHAGKYDPKSGKEKPEKGFVFGRRGYYTAWKFPSPDEERRERTNALNEEKKKTKNQRHKENRMKKQGIKNKK